MIIFCLTARKMRHFKRTVVLYPICMLAIWLPAVFLGVAANHALEVPAIRAKLEARQTLATQGAALNSGQRTELRARAAGDDVLLRLLDYYAPLWLAGLLGAGIMAAVMASDSQILALSTMFSEDIFTYYEGKERFGEAAQVIVGRIFVIILTLIAYAIALKFPQPIFDLAVQYAFSGYSALLPLLIGALFWKRSTKWGALATTLWTAVSVIAVALFQTFYPTPAVVWSVGGLNLLERTPGGTAILGLLPVVPMVIVSAILMIVVSLITKRPSATVIGRYFSK
jgi:SSS family solute:Na+ symporter